MDFTPASHHKKKPVTKKQLQKIRANLSVAQDITKYTKPREEADQKEAKAELDDLLDLLG